jgi:hypothetical protein
VHSGNLSWDDMLRVAPTPGASGVAQQLAQVKDWADLSLLPPFDAVSKYFYFTVQAIRLSPEGFSWTLFSPTPPKLR